MFSRGELRIPLRFKLQSQGKAYRGQSQESWSCLDVHGSLNWRSGPTLKKKKRELYMTGIQRKTGKQKNREGKKEKQGYKYMGCSAEPLLTKLGLFRTCRLSVRC